MLKTERTLSAAETWSLYLVLLQAEEGLACLKGALGLRPNFHQLEKASRRASSLAKAGKARQEARPDSC